MPGLYHEWWQALQSGDSAVAQLCQKKIYTLTALYAQVPSAIPYVPVVRYGLRAIGLDIGEPCSPLNEVPFSVQQLMKQILDELD